MLRRKREVFAPTDGVLSVMDATAARSVRGIDFSGTYGLDERHRLAFRSTRLRTQDVELAAADGVEVTRKLVCRRAPDVDAGTIVAIDGYAYDVTRVDLMAKTMTLTLSQLMCDGTCDLVRETTTRDARGESVTGEVPTTVYVRKARMGGTTDKRAGVQTVWPTVSLTIRACDWEGERIVSFRGASYAVRAAKGDGEWLVLECEERPGTHGR